MIPIIAILSGGGSQASHGIGVGRDPGRAVHALDPRDVRHRRGGPVSSRGKPADAATTCRSTRRSSPMTCATSRSPTALAIAAAFLPLEPAWPKWIVAVVLILIYGWYVKGHFEDDADVDLERSAAAPIPSPRRRRRPTARIRPCPRLRVVNLQVLAALGLIIVGGVLLRRVRSSTSRRRSASPRSSSPS